MMGWNWDQMGSWMWGGHMLWGVVPVLLLLVATGGLIAWAARGFSGENRRESPPPTPLEIAQSRYARGEISREEYESIRRDLQGG